MLVVNLFGAPGAGKTSLAFLISGILKTEYPSLTIECPNEVAKMVYYDEAPKALNCQLYIAGRQQWQIDRCAGHVDIVVCDSPILLSPVYARDGGQGLPDEFDAVCRFYHNKHPSLNFFVTRDHPFESKARFHGEADEDRLTKAFKEALRTVPYQTVLSTVSTASLIAAMAAQELIKIKEQNPD